MSTRHRIGVQMSHRVMVMILELTLLRNCFNLVIF